MRTRKQELGDMNIIGAKVEKQRKAIGMKQKDLAESLDVTPAAVSKLLSDGSNLRNSSIAKVAVALKCDVIPAKLVPIEERSSKETSSTLSSGMTVTTTIHKEVGSPNIENDQEFDSVDEEYRELCAQEKASETVNKPKEKTLTGLGTFRMAGVAA